MKHLTDCLDKLVSERTVSNIYVRIGKSDLILCDEKRFSQHEITDSTLFDMASVTKILATTTLALIAMDRHLLSPEDCVDKFYPGSGRMLSVGNLMTHTIGIGHKSLNVPGVEYENVAEYILSIRPDIPEGTDVLYSCPAFILLGKILEKIYGMRLDAAFEKYVAEPLGMENTSFCPDRTKDIVNANLSDSERGLVNDYNARFLGGVSGNAGIFSDIGDLTKFAAHLVARGAPLYGTKIFEAASRNYTAGMSESRGLGFVYVDERFRQTGGLFPTGSIGHCGHTGQSLFADARSGFYVIILSDANISVIRREGREDYDQVIKMREDIHRAIKDDGYFSLT